MARGFKFRVTVHHDHGHGAPGTGKSHLANAVAYQATLQGHDLRYLEADTEFGRYALASPTERTVLLKEWVEPDLLI